MVGGVWNGVLLGEVWGQHVPCRFCVLQMVMVIFLGMYLFSSH